MLKAGLAVPTQPWWPSSVPTGEQQSRDSELAHGQAPGSALLSARPAVSCLNPNKVSRPASGQDPAVRPTNSAETISTKRRGDATRFPRGGMGLALRRAAVAPRPVQPVQPGRLAQHLVPVEDGLALLLHLQLPALLGAFHALQDRVGAGSPERGHGGSRGAGILQWGEKGCSSVSCGVPKAQHRQTPESNP